LRARRRTVEGVVLTRTAPDIWAANGWSFRKAEGETFQGRQEWWAYDRKNTFTVHTSLRGCVRAMLRAAKCAIAKAEGRW
jgi:hypothetical protein